MTEPSFLLDTAASRPRFLLIDDDSMVGRLLGDAAEECGCEPIRAPTMAGFQRIFCEAAPDIVAVDLSVRGYNGGEVLSFLAGQRYRGTVLILSGLDNRTLSSALRLGMALGLNIAEPLAKPFRIDELAERIGTGAAEMAH